MIPSHKNKSICFAKVGSYYGDDSCTYKNEIEVINRIDNKEDYGIQIKCPYKKRRKISILKIVSGQRINANLYKALISYHGIDNIDKYSDFVLSSIYNIYYRNNKISMVFNVEKKKNIDAFDLSSFICNCSKMFKLINNEVKISTKANLNSPGDLILVIQQYGSLGLEILKSHSFIIIAIAIWFSIVGGEIGPIKFNSILELMMKWKEHKLKMRSDELEISKKELDLLDEKLKNAASYLEEIKSSSDNLEINKDDIDRIIDFNKYRHGRDN